MNMRLLLALITFCSPLHAEDQNGVLKERIRQFGLLKTRPIADWPKDTSSLFQGLSKEMPFAIQSKEDHLKAIEKIPKHLLEGHRLGKTIEKDGWHYTSVDQTESDGSSWFRAIASKMGSKQLLFSYTW